MATTHIMLMLFLGTLPIVSLPSAPGQVNLVANGDFASGTDGVPTQWTVSGSAVNVTQALTVERDTDGGAFARLDCTRCEGQGADSHAMLVQGGHIRLNAGRLYQFSCRMRAVGLASRTVGVAIRETKGWLPGGLFTEFTVNPSWQWYTAPFHATRDIGPTGRLQIWFAEPGRLDVADVEIVEIAEQEVVFTDTIAPVPGVNLVPNGSFELGGAGWSSLGTGTGWGDLNRLHGSIQTGGTQGHAFLRIPLGADQTPVLYFDYYLPLVKRELRVLAASLGWIPVERGATYTISCDMRASVAGVRALLGARSQDPEGRGSGHCGPGVELTTSWRRYTHTFRPEGGWVFVFVGPDLAEEQRVDVDVDAVQLEKSDQATVYQPRAELEFAIEPSAPAGIYVAGAPGSLSVRLCNHATTPVDVRVEFQVSDYADQPVALPPASVTVPARTAIQHDVPLVPDWRGYYRIRATAHSGAVSESKNLAIAIVPPRTTDDSVCGINHAFVSEDQIRAASAAGVTWYRDWSLKWQHIEPARGEYQWAVGDVQIDRVLQAGGRVLPLLPPFPSADWNSEAPQSLVTGTRYPANRLRSSFAPQDPNDLAGFVGKAVERYRDRIRVWEFLNEPVYTSYALPSDREGQLGGKRYTPADYVALLEVAARGMRAADPTCQVIGGIGGTPDTLTREVLEAGCLNHVDIFNLHMYPGKRAPESYVGQMRNLLAMMDAQGGRKPIWITEFSYYGADNLTRRPFIPRAGSWSEERLLDSERQCADYTVRFFLTMLAHGVEKVFIHSGASGRVNDPNYECALFDNGSVPRKLFAALAVLTDLLGARPECAAASPLGNFAHAAAFETQGQALVALWSESDALESRVVIPDEQGLRVLDVVGRPLPGGTQLLGSSPIYLLGPSGRAAELLQKLRRE